MTNADLAGFRELLKRKRTELSAKPRALESIAVERSADLIEEVQYKSARELAIAGLNRESAIRRNIEPALIRISNESFCTCTHCEQEISRRRLEAVPWTPCCIRCQEAADRGDEERSQRCRPDVSRRRVAPLGGGKATTPRRTNFARQCDDFSQRIRIQQQDFHLRRTGADFRASARNVWRRVQDGEVFFRVLMLVAVGA